MEPFRCSHPGCPNKFYSTFENALEAYDQAVTHGWFKSADGWLCAQHSPHANPPAGGSPRPAAAKAPRKKSNATQWTIVILVAIVIVIVIAVVGIGANNSSNAAYKAGYEVGYNSNNFVSDNQAGSYCQDLWNNLSGSALSKYGSNEGNWVGGCTNGVKAAN